MSPAEPPFQLATAWHRLLQEVELARHYPAPFRLNLGGSVARNPILERVLPSLLYVKMVSLLDDALQEYVASHELEAPKRYPDSLGGRIGLLGDSGTLGDPAQLRSIKDRRNELAHEVKEHANWEELEGALQAVHNELQGLGLVGSRPEYSFFAERSALHETERSDALFERTYTYGLKRENSSRDLHRVD